MAVPYKDYQWEQGADLNITLVFKSGPTGAEIPVNLTGYQVRMDVSSAGTRIYTFNSADILDLDGPVGPGTLGDTNKEAVLGTDGTILISVPRALTLPGGIVYAEMMGNRIIYPYDIFLRDTTTKQIKLLTGNITVNKSITLWA